MPKPKTQMSFYLTDDQMKIVQPLLDQASNHYFNKRPGSVFCQIDCDGKVTGNFIPYKYTNWIEEVLEELGKEKPLCGPRQSMK